MTNTYIQPNTDIVKVELQQMIADSTPLNQTQEATTQDDGTGEEEYKNSLSKDFDFFTFEE